MSIWLLLVAAPHLGAADAPYGIGTRPVAAPYLGMPAVAPAATWQAVPAFPGLTFPDPIGVTPAPGSNHLYVNCRQGQVYCFPNDPAVTVKTMFLDLSAHCQGYDDGGLLGMAFHPQFGTPGSPNRGYVYVWYSYREFPTAGPNPPAPFTDYRNRLSRFSVPDGVGGVPAASAPADPASEFVMIDQVDRHLWHNGGGMFFHPVDGFLYLTLGDEGDGNDSFGNAQRIDRNLFSGVLRIDVDMRGAPVSHPPPREPQDGDTFDGATYRYFIPDDNPWVGVPNALEEFWAIGLRSPHRMTYDAVTGSIWAGDIGQGAREEVDLIEKGGNYQWPYREGATSGPKPQPATLIGTAKPPLFEYGRDLGRSVIGGYVYRGSAHAADLGGRYIFGDHLSGSIWALDQGGGAAAVVQLCVMPSVASAGYGTGLSGFGTDHDNELYLCQLGFRTVTPDPMGGAPVVKGAEGRIFKLQRTTVVGAALPGLLSQTGAFSDVAALTPAPGLVPYDVNSPLWSDGAAKRRWISLPNDGINPITAGERIGFATTGAWTFPAGTVFVKHFELPDRVADPAHVRRLETRLLVRDANGGVYGASYRWLPDNSDAVLVDGSQTETIPVVGGDPVQWFFPGRQDCTSCHTSQASHVLGVSTRQLNRHLGFPGGVADNQLRTWNHLAMFDQALDEAAIPGMAHLAAVGDGSATLEHRVRSYLDANCAHCHRPDGVRAVFDARFDTPLAFQDLINGAVSDPLGIANAKVVAPRAVARSIAHNRMDRTDTARMPPLARNHIDTQAVQVMAQWIASLAIPPVVALTAPANGSLHLAGQPIALVASASDDGQVVSVDFYADRVKVADGVPGPSGTWTATWSSAPIGVHGISAVAIDNEGTAEESGFAEIGVRPPGGGDILRELWTGIPGAAVIDLISSPSFLSSPPTSISYPQLFEAPIDLGDSYGTRMRGFIYPPQSGFYTFWIASDDGSRLLLSSDRSPANAVQIASIDNGTTPRQWTRDSLQQSNPIHLVAGRKYYIEALHKEGLGGDHLAVGWRLPSGKLERPVPGARLSRFPDAAPQGHPQSLTTQEDVPVAIVLTGSDPEADTLTYAIVSGPAHGVLSGSAPALTYTPASNWSGSDSFSVKANDGSSDSPAVTIAIVVSAVNDPPVAAAQIVSLAEDGSLSLTLAATDIDGGSGPLTFAIVSGPTHGTVAPAASSTPVYTPSQDFNGSDSFLFTAHDGLAASSPTLVSITVTPVNDAPACASQSLTMLEDGTLGITVTGTDPEGSALTYSVVAGPLHGALSGSAPNLTYTPTANYSGSDSFTVRSHDGALDSATATISIGIGGVNDPPVSAAQSLAMLEDGSLGITLAGSDPESSPLTFTVTSAPAHGTLSGSAPNLVYTPSLDYAGTDAFSVTCHDGAITSAPAIISITIAPVNDAPACTAQALATPEDTPLAIVLTGSDVEGSALTYSVVSGPTHGALAGSAPNLTYTPPANYSGPDSFTVRSHDGTVPSATVTIAITVTAVNDLPLCSPQSLAMLEDGTLVITLTGSDAEASPLTYAVTVAPAHGSLSGTAPNLVYTPAPHYAGADAFTVTCHDGTASSAPATVSIAIAPVNDAPVCTPQSLLGPEDTPLPIVLIGSDVDLDPLTFTVLTQPLHGTLSGTPPNLTYTPDANYNGTDAFTASASDGVLASPPATIAITVRTGNDAPTCDAQSLVVAEDQALPIQLTGNDPDGDALTFTVVTGPAHGALTGTLPDLVYTPGADYVGADAFTVRATDSLADSAAVTIAITVTSVNDAPTGTGLAVSLDEDSSAPVVLTASDVDGDAIAFTVVSPPAHGLLTGVAPALTYTPHGNYHGSDAISIAVADEAGAGFVAVVTITVVPVNDAPVCDPQVVGTPMNHPLTITLTGGDIDGDVLTFQVVTGPAHGALSGAGASLIYTPAAAYHGPDEMTVTVHDGQSGSLPAVISITVAAPGGNAPGGGGGGSGGCGGGGSLAFVILTLIAFTRRPAFSAKRHPPTDV